MSFWCQFLDPHLMTCTNQILVSELLLYLDFDTSTLGGPYLSCWCPLLLYNHQEFKVMLFSEIQKWHKRFLKIEVCYLFFLSSLSFTRPSLDWSMQAWHWFYIKQLCGLEVKEPLREPLLTVEPYVHRRSYSVDIGSLALRTDTLFTLAPEKRDRSFYLYIYLSFIYLHRRSWASCETCQAKT